MVFIYTANRCSSCQKAKRWLELHNIEYKEKNLNTFKLTEFDIDLILSYEEIDFTKIISTRSKIFKEQKIDLFSMKIQQVKKFIVKNPSICKKPIIFNNKSIVIGYNQEDIRIFMPKNLRQYIIKNNISIKNQSYVKKIKKYLTDLKKKK
ncbi:MAG: regulatory protein spx [Candidatus Phytoplasma cynodontis]|uniref:ArsC/Spx/MgsR family protein n=1 Tax='Cynodon dactylon' phytoplasma TaxID=295320 RepID=UPI001265CDF7|nr:ArsC/Spx/MgsR family protein ['Cynodon dactylon' phytoplasma]KAB8122043.1 transcriptional regulator Spx ['Cynodon dactylon' phytoplasma]WIA07540.1 MAG: regulatory protein spx [Candidatus Phytoplasma cynodontis]